MGTNILEEHITTIIRVEMEMFLVFTSSTLKMEAVYLSHTYVAQLADYTVIT
jgi:hypothetical protein